MSVVYFQRFYTPLEDPYSNMSDLSKYEAYWLELQQTDTSFAVLVMAHLRTQATTQDFAGRFR